MQPDAMTIAALAFVPLVRIVDRKGATAVEVAESLRRQAGGDVIDTDRCFLVTFPSFVGAELAMRDVIVGDKTRPPARVGVILVEIEPGFLCVYNNRVSLVGGHLQ